MKNNIVKEKSCQLALEIVNVYKSLTRDHKEFILSKQLVRSGTSVGANIEEAIGAHSKKDFLSKIVIAYKEARETRYWLNLLRDSGYIKEEMAKHLIDKAEELCKIMARIQMTLRKQIEK
ncbi:MAG: four helix bundle protein [Candidatus Omnitrophota bacterium]